MADFESALLPFPHRQRSPSSVSSVSSLSTGQPVLADAELRVDIVKNLLQQIGGPDGLYPQDLRLRITLYATEALLDETVLLYRRALSGLAAD